MICYLDVPMPEFMFAFEVNDRCSQLAKFIGLFSLENHLTMTNSLVLPKERKARGKEFIHHHQIGKKAKVARQTSDICVSVHLYL